MSGSARVWCGALLMLAFAGSAKAQSPAAPQAQAGRVRWELAPAPDTSARGDVRAWWLQQARGGDPALVRRAALAQLAAGDTARADSLLARPSLATSPWAWLALDQRVRIAVARGDTARADTLLAASDLNAWPEGERAAWLWSRARLRLGLRDSSGAQEFARRAVQTYPGVAAAAVPSLVLLESIAAARRDVLPLEIARAAVEIDVLRADRASAARRLRALLARTPRLLGAERWRITLRLAEVQRAARRPLEARVWADSALRSAPEGEERFKIELERARCLRDAARTDSALALYTRIVRRSGDADTRATAQWEFAREAQDRSRWRDAIAGFARLAQMGGPRASDARVQRGLILLAIGERDSAGLAFAGATSEAAQFWRGVILRGSAKDRARGDSLLMMLARKPGYAFYRACARETLGVRGWPGAVLEAAEDSSATVLLRARRLLAADSTGEDAMTLLSRWAAADARLDDTRPGIAEWLASARMAFSCGRTALGTLWVDRAIGAAQSRADSIQWALVPWAYPPAFEPLVRAAAVDSISMDAPLLWGLIRQESRFDPRARSRSNALGLTQLKVEAASDAARALRESAPGEAALFDPSPAVRYGAQYLGALLRRFERHVPVALAAYNAGPSAVRKDWRDLIARGGEALYCEVASNADSQDYVKRITGFRAAYHELAPSGR